MVSSTGNGRRYAAQALLGSLAQRETDVLLTAVLVYASRLGPVGVRKLERLEISRVLRMTRGSTF